MKRSICPTVFLLACVMMLSACESLSTGKAGAAVSLPATPAPPSAIDAYVDMMAALSGNDRARQSDVFFEVERSYTQAPTTMNQVRYALALSVPSHPASDPIKAKKLLEQALANPERLSGPERSLCELMLVVAEQTLKMQLENRRLAATVDDKSRTQSNADRRFQQQNEEISRLRKALDAAQQKLDAIKDLEKSISERSASPTGTRDAGNRDNPSQTQAPPAGR